MPSDKIESIMKLFSFPKSKRLVKQYQFKQVLQSGVSVRDSRIILYASSNSLGLCRIGISVSKKCGNAVRRNRIKRLIREIFRKNQQKIGSDTDYLVIIAKDNAKKAGKSQLNYQYFESSFLNLAAKALEKIG